jgi:ATP-binding cassette, subfamily B, bacterial PglK
MKKAQLKSLWQHISKRRQRQFFLLLMLMILASLLEIVSIGLVMPFLGVLIAPEQVYQHQLMKPLIELLVLTESSQLILPITTMFIVMVIFAGIVRLTLLYAMIKISFLTGSDLSIKVYRNTLYQDYLTHMNNNSSEVVNSIITKVSAVINGVLKPMLTLISSMIFLVGIMSILFAVNIRVASTVFIGIGLSYWIIVYYTRQQLKENSHSIADQSTLMIKTLQEGLGGIRDVIIDGSQEFYCRLFRNADFKLRSARGNNQFIGGSPRFAIEMIGMVLIAVYAYMATQGEGGILAIMPILGVFALGAQRMLPVLQQAYSAFSIIKGSIASFEDVLCLLNQSIPEYVNKLPDNPISFTQKIELKNLSFQYSKNMPLVLNNVNITIMKGSRIGFIGTTGGGKSTLIDVVMGLLSQTSGEFNVDSQPINDENRRSWQMHIAHVPQNIYLSDGTIEENIAFGVLKSDVNHQQVKKAAKQAQISDLVEGWQDGYQTLVGERGVRLSGGQRQRIGIARALYKEVDVLIFDEATSALDNETESAVMEAIKGLEKDITILIVAHRLTTLKECDQIIKLDGNDTIHIGNYQNLINLSKAR